MRALAFLSLGSNVGEPEQNLIAALDRLYAHEQISLKDISSLYLTEPVGYRDQPWFLNCCASVVTALTPSELVALGKQVEMLMHRNTTVSKGPRIIDIDVLLWGEKSVQTQSCTVPHPEMLKRRFVLVPLLEIAPMLRHPSGFSIQEALSALQGGEEVILVKKKWHRLQH
ncbi:MAG: 2-amino-4-hydroxy-6-hydroxymethyldihydropteridine diphosphokinase [Armatimonadetes bacterium]|nr:2-amino-4-hydroxy-6-hydroxymethyldihydropteridine diphosphokinase [Armatimonadota bacterium]